MLYSFWQEVYILISGRIQTIMKVAINKNVSGKQICWVTEYYTVFGILLDRFRVIKRFIT
jgi:hypothetical protein